MKNTKDDSALPSSDKPLRVSHTPGSWSVGGTFNPNSSDPRQNIWGLAAPGSQSGELICQGATPQNAKHIVRCVNAHAELLEALFQAESLIDTLQLACLDRVDCSRDKRQATIRAAIAKASAIK